MEMGEMEMVNLLRRSLRNSRNFFAVVSFFVLASVASAGPIHAHLNLPVHITLVKKVSIPAGNHSVTLTWNPSTVTASTYFLYRGTATGKESTTPLNAAGVATGCTSSTTCTFMDTTVIGGSTYFYYAEAQSNGVNSVPSAEAINKATGTTAIVVPVAPATNLHLDSSSD